MAAQYMRVQGHIRDGKLYAELPDDVPDGDIEVLLPVSANEPPITEAELQSLLIFQGQTLGEILASGLVGAGADWDIGDSEEWVQTQRRSNWHDR